MKSYRYRHNHNISRQTAVVFVVLSLFMSIVFFNVYISNTSVEKSESESIVADFEDYDYQKGRGHSINYLFLIMESGENLSIDGVCVNEKLQNTIEEMEKGTRLHALVSNNTNTVVELKTDSEELLSFDYAQKKLRQEGIGFLVLSVFMLAGCAYFIYIAITTKEKLTKEDIRIYLDILRGK